MGLNDFILKKINKNYAENMKKIVGAVWELPAKQHSQFSPTWVEMTGGLDMFKKIQSKILYTEAAQRSSRAGAAKVTSYTV